MRYKLLIIFLLFFSHLIKGQFSGGSGTEADPYLISTPAGLDSLRDYDDGSHYFEQTQDIDMKTYLSTRSWDPIGTQGGSYNKWNGYYDGQGYSIINFTIEPVDITNAIYETDRIEVGFFGAMIGELKNIVFDSASVTIDTRVSSPLNTYELSDFSVVGAHLQSSHTPYSLDSVVIKNSNMFIYIDDTISMLTNDNHAAFLAGEVNQGASDMRRIVVEDSEIIFKVPDDVGSKTAGVIGWFRQGDMFQSYIARTIIQGGRRTVAGSQVAGFTTIKERVLGQDSKIQNCYALDVIIKNEYGHPSGNNAGFISKGELPLKSNSGIKNCYAVVKPDSSIEEESYYGFLRTGKGSGYTYSWVVIQNVVWNGDYIPSADTASRRADTTTMDPSDPWEIGYGFAYIGTSDSMKSYNYSAYKTWDFTNVWAIDTSSGNKINDGYPYFKTLSYPQPLPPDTALLYIDDVNTSSKKVYVHSVNVDTAYLYYAMNDTTTWEFISKKYMRDNDEFLPDITIFGYSLKPTDHGTLYFKVEKKAHSEEFDTSLTIYDRDGLRAVGHGYICQSFELAPNDTFVVDQAILNPDSIISYDVNTSNNFDTLSGVAKGRGRHIHDPGCGWSIPWANNPKKYETCISGLGSETEIQADGLIKTTPTFNTQSTRISGLFTTSTSLPFTNYWGAIDNDLKAQQWTSLRVNTHDYKKWSYSYKNDLQVIEGYDRVNDTTYNVLDVGELVNPEDDGLGFGFATGWEEDLSELYYITMGDWWILTTLDGTLLLTLGLNEPVYQSGALQDVYVVQTEVVSVRDYFRGIHPKIWKYGNPEGTPK